MKDIQRKDYKKNKENNKETINPDKNNIDKSKEILKIERHLERINEMNPTNLTKIYELNNLIEKKALSLAEMKQISTQNSQVLKLLDVLFDCKKMQREMIDKL